MARILVATIPVAGHVGPFVPVVRMLKAAGHQVTWYTGKKFAKAPQSAEVEHAPYQKAIEFDDANFDATFAGRESLKGLDQLRFDMKHIFIDSAPGQLADLRELAAKVQPDLVLCDPGMIGAILLSEETKVPCGVLGILPLIVSSSDAAPFGLGLPPANGFVGRLRNGLLNFLVQRVLFGAVQKHWLQMRTRVGMAATGWWMDAAFERIAFWIQPTVPSFEYPRRDLPSTVHFTGLVPSEAPAGLEDPPFWSELDGSKPIVHVTQGTLANLEPRLFRPAIEALANEDVLVVISTGRRSPSELGLDELPANARVATFLDYGRLLPKLSAMVTNGGYGGVQAALRHGVPLVVAGMSEDKPEVAARVAWSGAGINLRTETPRAEAVRDAVRRVLREESFRQNAQRLAREYESYDALALIRAKIDAAIGA